VIRRDQTGVPLRNGLPVSGKIEHSFRREFSPSALWLPGRSCTT